jgi:small GTP-binding protein
MIKKKICIIGEFGVGKTSIVNRYVNDAFSERYLTTIGVSINSKAIEFNHKEMLLLLWDIAGEQVDSPLNPIYLKGLSGYVVVCDVTRGNFLGIVERMTKPIVDTAGNLPHIVLLNKIDTIPTVNFYDEVLELEKRGHKVFLTSAKSGESVVAAFNSLLEMVDSNEYTAKHI